MNWIGTKISQRTHEGQKVLGREVVVASKHNKTMWMMAMAMSGLRSTLITTIVQWIRGILGLGLRLLLLRLPHARVRATIVIIILLLPHLHPHLC
jgi:hypothetical protein